MGLRQPRNNLAGPQHIAAEALLSPQASRQFRHFGAETADEPVPEFAVFNIG
jgi:hypothetical protein